MLGSGEDMNEGQMRDRTKMKHKGVPWNGLSDIIVVDEYCVECLIRRYRNVEDALCLFVVRMCRNCSADEKALEGIVRRSHGGIEATIKRMT